MIFNLTLNFLQNFRKILKVCQKNKNNNLLNIIYRFIPKAALVKTFYKYFRNLIVLFVIKKRELKSYCFTHSNLNSILKFNKRNINFDVSIYSI